MGAFSLFERYIKCLISDFFFSVVNNLVPRALFSGFGSGAPHLQSQGKAPWGRGCVVKSYSISLVAKTFNNRISHMSALHRGYCTLAVRHEKCLNPAFFKVSIDHLQSNPHVRPPPASDHLTHTLISMFAVCTMLLRI